MPTSTTNGASTDMNRFFKIMPDKYESLRTAMDAESGYPNNAAVTWFAPANEAPKAPDGCCLIASIAPIAERFAAEACHELTEAEYLALLPQLDPEEI